MKAAVISPALSIWWKVGAISGASAVLLEPREGPASAQELGDGSALPVDPLGVLLATPLCRRPGLAGGLITTGTLLFSGSLYAMTLTQQKKLGIITIAQRVSDLTDAVPSVQRFPHLDSPSCRTSSSKQERLRTRVQAMTKWGFVVALIVLLATPSFVLGACPNKCSGHGKCGLNDVCQCMQNWVGGDCSGRQCPFTRAWHDTAQRDDDAHYYAECGNRGTCDRATGECTCDAGFIGSGCRRMQCPNDCSGHGTCEFIEELAADTFHKRVGGVASRKYTLWDQEKIMGCVCDANYEGHDCSMRSCEGYLTYYDPYGNAYTTEKIAFGGSGSTFTSLDDDVTLSVVAWHYRMLNEDTPAYRPLTELTECSGRGTCDYDTGTCACFAGHMGLACQKQEALV
ncbi:EGF-like domain, extracellular [Phytophthora cactorum]|nr:EGF-like domain, extracellular [Phytophthora cactorum]